MQDGYGKTMRSAGDLVAFGQGNVEALIKSGQVWASGIQDMGRHVAAAMQASVEESVATARAMTSTTSLKEMVELQAKYARGAVERLVADSGRITDASFKLTEQALAPLTARVTLAMETFGKAA